MARFHRLLYSDPLLLCVACSVGLLRLHRLAKRLSPPKILVPVTAVFRPLTTCMPHTHGEGGGKDYVRLSRTRFFSLLLSSVFPVPVVNTPSPLVFPGTQNIPMGSIPPEFHIHQYPHLRFAAFVFPVAVFNACLSSPLRRR